MDIDRFLASHDGVVTRRQARACGLSDDQIARRVAAGLLRRCGPGIFHATAWSFSAAAAVRVGAEWAGPKGGALAGVTAAWWWGFEVDGPRPVTVVVPPDASRCAPRGVTVHRHDPGRDRERRSGLWVLGRALTVLDAAVALGREGQPFLDRALQRGRVTLDDLRQAQSRHLGRSGSAAAGRLIARAGDHAASEVERRTIAALRAGGITGWSVNLPVTLPGGRGAVLDLAFPDVRLVIEVDGWAHHVERDRFVGDRARKRALVADGWTVVEVTWWDLETDPGGVVADVRRTLRRLGGT